MQPGDVVADRFVVERPAGAGGAGEVWRAIDRATGGPVAIKVLRNARGDVERFEREARVLAELQHPAIVHYVAHGVGDPGAAWLAMEWLDGETLAARLKREPLTAAESIDVARRAAEALGAAHARGIVHRDVTPRNLFLVGRDLTRLRLLDFGLARPLETATMTGSGAALGTPGYMAPEQARGDRDVDARADVFSLGCVLYECLTGMHAFRGRHSVAILAKILFEEAPRVDESRRDVPPALGDLVARMLSKDGAARPRDGGAVARELASLGRISVGRPPARSTLPPALTEGEQRIVSVILAQRAESALFDSTATLGDDRDPWTLGVRELASAHGAVSALVGSGSLVCTMSASTAGSEQALRATRCALALSAWSAMRVALATGRGRIEGRLLVGEAIDRAAALLRDTAPGRVIVDPATAELIRSRFEVHAEGGAHVAVAERAAPEVERTLLGRPTPCVGRDRELKTLEAFWDEVVGERVGRLVLVTAPAGMGKSRVRHELVKRIRAAGAAEIWMGRGDPTRAGAPLSLLAQAIKGTAAMQDGEPPEMARDKLRARVERHVRARDVVRLCGFLGEMTGARFPDEDDAPLRAARAEAIVMADQMRRAWEDFVAAECDAAPVLLVLEDLHWGDLPTVSFVDSAMRNLGERPWMVVALARPEVHEVFPHLWEGRGVHEARLAGLSRRASERLVAEVLGDRVDAVARARLVERAAGNALFLEELIRAAAEGNADRAPDTVLGIVEERLGALEVDARRLLRAASIVGGVFWESAVRALVGGAADTADWLQLLAERELVQPRAQSRFPGEREFVFRHDLVREAAYAMLTDDDRALGHRLAGEWLQKAGEANAMVVAEHLEKGGDRVRATSAWLVAARQASDSDDLGAAIARAERGVACGAEGARLGELRLVQAEAHMWRGSNVDAERCASDAFERLPRGSEWWFNAGRWSVLANARLGSGARGAEVARAMLATGADSGSAAARRRALASAAGNMALCGERLLGARLVEEGDRDESDVVASDYAAWSRALLALGDGDAAAFLAAVQRSFELAERAGDQRRACARRVDIGFSMALVGDVRGAENALRGALASADRMGLTTVVSAARNNLAPVLAAQGNLDEARRTADLAAHDFRRQGNVRMEGASRAYLADILLACGDREAAVREARRAVELLAPVPPLRPFALAIVARCELACGDIEAARAAIVEAVRAESVEEGEPTIRLVHAEVLAAAGDTAGAKAAIAVARDRLLARAARISDATLRAGFLANVADNARTLERAREWIGD